MQMSYGEIVRSYKESKNPKNQVKILAELNDCDKKTIVGILNDAGVLDKKTQGAYRRSGLLSSKDVQPEAAGECPATEADAGEIKSAEPDAAETQESAERIPRPEGARVSRTVQNFRSVGETQESAERIPQSVVLLAQKELDRMRPAYQDAKITVEKYEELLDFVEKYGQ